MDFKLLVGEYCDIELKAGLSLYKDNEYLNIFIKAPYEVSEDNLLNSDIEIFLKLYDEYNFLEFKISRLINKGEIEYNIRNSKEYSLNNIYQANQYYIVFILLNNDNIVKAIRKIKMPRDFGNMLCFMNRRQLEFDEVDFINSKYKYLTDKENAETAFSFSSK